MASLDQPKVSAKTTGQGNWSANSRIKVLLRAPPPQTTANEGRDGNSGSTPTMLAVVKAVSVAAASSIASASTINRAVGLASGSSRAVPVEGGATALQHQIVEQPIARTCVAGNRFLTRRDKT